MQKIIYVFVLCIALAGCKKEQPTPQPEPLPPPADGTPSTSTLFYGVLKCGTYSMQLSPVLVAENKSFMAWFGNQPAPGIYPAGYVKVSKVKFNNDSADFNTPLKYYYNPYITDLTTQNWKITGDFGIPSFSHSSTLIEPSFSGVLNLPDSISKGTGATIIVNNVANANNATLNLLDGTNTTTGFYSATLTPGNNTIVISSANLAALNTTTAGNIGLILQNKNAFVYGSKDFQFIREAQFNKKIKIKP